MTALPDPRQNHLLNALPAVDLKRISPYLELVPMPVGKSFSELDGKSLYAYFPITSIVSLLYVMEAGTLAEIASVGNEGMLDISLFAEGITTPCLAIVRTAGFGYKMKARLLMEEFNRAGVLERLLLRYAQALSTQISLTAECNLHHSVYQQLCRWLLQTIDRLPSNELSLSLDLVASMFGVNREAVKESLGNLHRAGFINYRLGHITVLDRLELENQVCECYGLIKQEFKRLQGLDFDSRPMPGSIKAWSKASTSINAQM
jgi:DNA-binding transcriptional regulator YhcF (GntR family)